MTNNAPHSELSIKQETEWFEHKDFAISYPAKDHPNEDLNNADLVMHILPRASGQ